MVQINITSGLLKEIREESERTGIKMFKLVEFGWQAYKNKLKLSSVNEEIVKGREELSRELSTVKVKYDKLKGMYNSVNMSLSKYRKIEKKRKK